MKNTLLVLVVILFFSSARSQYCTPSINSSGMYLNAVQYNLPGFTSGVTSGTSNFTGSNGVSDYTGYSSGTIQRNCYVGIPVNAYNPTGSAQNLNIRVYADWNNDNDFDDASELAWDFDFSSLGAASSLGTGAGFTVPPFAASTVRVRFILRQGGTKATACGTFTGESEDYILNIVANQAPVTNGHTSFLAPLTETQTNNEGTPVHIFMRSPVPTAFLTGDPDACLARGIAITSINATNGQWEYKIGSGSWTAIGAVSNVNALLLSGTTSSLSRIRFVPSGSGSASFEYKAWDQSTGVNGGYADASVGGGATAFSTTNETASITVYSTASTSSDVKVYMATTGSSTSTFNIRSASLNKTTGVIKHSEEVTSDGLNGYGTDIDIDPVNNKLVWIGGATGVDILRSDLDGNSFEVLQSNLLSYGTGIAAGAGKIFVIDYGVGIYSFDADGSNATLITGGAGQVNDINVTGDIEFLNNKIYYVNQPGTGDFKILQTNADGTGTVELVSSPSYIIGMYVTSSSIFWTELDGFNNASVKSMPISGGTITDIVTEANQYFMDIMVDEANSLIYITTLDMPAYQNYRIKTVPITGGSTTRVLDLEQETTSIIFQRGLGTLPVQFINIKASRRGTQVLVEWGVGQEENLVSYAIERSADGVNFQSIGNKMAEGRHGYSFIDQQPLMNNNYYRIRALNADQSSQLSSTVLLQPLEGKPKVTVYPSLVQNGNVSIKLEDLTAGKYQLKVYNPVGQLVHLQNIQYNGGTMIEKLGLPASISKGVYQVILSGSQHSFQRKIVVQ